MTGGKQLIDELKIELLDRETQHLLKIYIDVYDNSLSRKWLSSLNHLLQENYHLEKNYCFFGFVTSDRNAEYLCDQINKTIAAINSANIGYCINDTFTVENTIRSGEIGDGLPGRKLVQEKFNQLHRYFEDLQGVSGNMSQFYLRADPTIRWHIRQINLLCHEYESWALSYRKHGYAPEWQRPSQLMCWLNAPRFMLDDEDLELFGIDTIARPLGGVFVGVNKAIGKHHWEVFHDEGRDSRIDELTTTSLRGQTEAAGDFDIEWANNPGEFYWMKKQLSEFRQWLEINGFDPDDKSLTIGHPQVAQVNLEKSFASQDYNQIWTELSKHLDVYSVSTSTQRCEYPYHWSDQDYIKRQVSILSRE